MNWALGPAKSVTHKPVTAHQHKLKQHKGKVPLFNARDLPKQEPGVNT